MRLSALDDLVLCLSGIKVRVYCQVGKTSQGKFALDVAVKTLGLYKKYVLCILLVSLPRFSSGAYKTFWFVC